MEENWNSYKDLMIYVEGGSFWMGSDYNIPIAQEREFPVHKVLLDSYYIGVYAVTQDIYKKVTGENPSIKLGDQKPVEHLLWVEAIIFCNRLSMKEGLNPVYELMGSADPDKWDWKVDLTDDFEADDSYIRKLELLRVNWEADGYRLPTEAEWEYAARGGQKSSGYVYAGCSHLDAVAWHRRNSSFNTYPVGKLEPNELGLYDMSGNVWEWCWDRSVCYDRNGYRKGGKVIDDYAKTQQVNPKGIDCDVWGDRIIRGGSWNLYKSFSRVAYRSFQDPNYRGVRMGVGLRLAATAAN